MREILFRGKQTDNGEWVYGSFIPDIYEVCATDEQKEEITLGFIRPFYKEKDGQVIQYVSRDTVGQYTGLMDKNGKKIFEGDILDHHVQGDVLVVRGAVEWDERNGRWAHRLKSSEPSFCLYNPAAYEVMGNIHDNPELLEGGNGK